MAAAAITDGWTPPVDLDALSEVALSATVVAGLLDAVPDGSLAEAPDRLVSELTDTVVRSLFEAGLQLDGLLGQADDRMRPGLEAVIAILDRTIRDMRTLVFDRPTGAPQPRLPSLRRADLTHGRATSLKQTGQVGG